LSNKKGSVEITKQHKTTYIKKNIDKQKNKNVKYFPTQLYMILIEN
jgi:hypothetical protein